MEVVKPSTNRSTKVSPVSSTPATASFVVSDDNEVLQLCIPRLFRWDPERLKRARELVTQKSNVPIPLNPEWLHLEVTEHDRNFLGRDIQSSASDSESRQTAPTAVIPSAEITTNSAMAPPATPPVGSFQLPQAAVPIASAEVSNAPAPVVNVFPPAVTGNREVRPLLPRELGNKVSFCFKWHDRGHVFGDCPSVQTKEFCPTCGRQDIWTGDCPCHGFAREAVRRSAEELAFPAQRVNRSAPATIVRPATTSISRQRRTIVVQLGIHMRKTPTDL